MASPKNTKGIVIKQETYDRLLALRDEQRISNKKASFDDIKWEALMDVKVERFFVRKMKTKIGLFISFL